MGTRIDLTGKRFERLCVQEYVSTDKGGNAKWRCICDCGTIKDVLAFNLKSGYTKSCGCFSRDTPRVTKHAHTVGKKPTKTYKALLSAKSRCYNPNTSSYNNCGGRGIVVCDRWLDKDHGFENFLVDMGECPKGLSLDRINTNGNYEKDNCKWSTYREQENNRRNNRRIEYQGECRTMTEWARLLGMKPTTLKERLNVRSVEEAFTDPVDTCHKHFRRYRRKQEPIEIEITTST